MPETPKSFEEWFENWYDTHSFSTSRQAAWDAWNAALSLPPQTAAVPARQDAVPEKEKCATCRDYEENIRGWIGQLGGDTAEYLSLELEKLIDAFTQPTQGTAVGEGELPPLDVDTKNPLWTIRDSLRARERQLREAIAQRDDATKESENLRRALAEAEFAILDTVNTAALDVPKPESEESAMMAGQRSMIACNEAWQEATEFDDRDETAFRHGWEAARARLRSLPSEPGFGVQRKAVENG